MRTTGGSVRERLARLPRAEGAELGVLVAEFTRREILLQLSDSQRLEVVRASARLDAWSAAMRARAIAALHQSVLEEAKADSADLAAHRGGADCGPNAGGEEVQDRLMAERQVTMEVSLVLGVSFMAADHELDLALDLADFPRVARALARGELDVRQARVILAGLRALHAGRSPDDPKRLAHLAELMTGFLGPDDSPESDDFDPDEPITDATASGVPYPLFRELDRDGVTLWSLPPARLRGIVTREAARLDAQFLAERAAEGRSARRLDVEDHPGCTSSLHLHTTPVHAAAAYRNVDDAARAARRGGDPRTLDQLRADIAIGWLTEGAYGTVVVRSAAPVEASADPAAGERNELVQPRADGPLIHVTVAMTTMLGLDEEPATLHGPRGPVPIPADLARELSTRRGARWRRLLYDPATGVATDVSPAYRPPPRMKEFVRARDGEQSRFPTSGATRLELDHVREYCHDRPAGGGETGPSNLTCAGKRDHQLKTDRLVRVTGDANDRLTYITPSGRRYVSYPAAYADVAPAAIRPPPPF